MLFRLYWLRLLCAAYRKLMAVNFVILCLLLDCLIAAYLWSKMSAKRIDRRAEEKMSDFKCPACGNLSGQVIDVRANETGVRRRRECQGCGVRYSTQESVVVPQALEEKKGQLQTLLAEARTLKSKINSLKGEIVALEGQKPGRPRRQQKEPELIPVTSLQDLKNLTPEQRKDAFEQARKRVLARVKREINGNGNVTK